MSRARSALRFALTLALALQVGAAAQELPSAAPAGRYELIHRTEYRYDRPVRLLPHLLRLTPQSPSAGIRSVAAFGPPAIEGPKVVVSTGQDASGNVVQRAWFDGTTAVVAIEARVALEVRACERLEPAHGGRYPVAYAPDERRALGPYFAVADADGPRLRALADSLPATSLSALSWLALATRLTHGAIAHHERAEPGVRTPEQTLELGGSCRDGAWLLIQLLRRAGVAARFVSGYQVPEEVLDEATAGALRGQPVRMALHAWVEAYLPAVGWIGLDPTTGRGTSGAYVALARADGQSGAMPVTGSFEWADVAGGSTLSVAMSARWLGR